jgi:CopG family nickel-responsive transcriptional regulator
MQRITITVDDDLMIDLDRLMAKRGYQNRSEAIRDLARAGMQQALAEAGTGRDCVGALVYVYDHSARELPKRLVHSAHEHRHERSQRSYRQRMGDRVRSRCGTSFHPRPSW